MRHSLVVLLVTCVSLTVEGRMEGNASTVASRELSTLSIRSPDLRLVGDNIVVCTSIDVSSLGSDSYIVDMRPKAIPGMHYHINGYLCREPGSDASAWDCGSSYGYPNLPNQGLISGPICDPSHGGDRAFEYQYQGGSEEEAAFHLPLGSGIPIGGETGRNSIVALFHYPRLNETIDGRTGVSELIVTVVQRPEVLMHNVNQFILITEGVIGAQSVGSVTGVKTMDRTIYPVSLYTHTHEMAIDIRVSIRRRDGREEEILRQSPEFRGMTDMTDWPATVIQSGDQLVIQCTYNNTRKTPLKVEYDEMCGVYVFYTSDDAYQMTEEPIYISMEKQFQNCSRLLSTSGFAASDEGSSSYTGDISRSLCEATAADVGREDVF